MTHLRNALLLAIVLAVTSAGGCQRTYQDFTPTSEPARPPGAPAHIPAGDLGTIGGRVVWSGDIPDVPPIRGLITTKGGLHWGEVPNHFAPRIDPKSQGIADAVVFLKASPIAGTIPPLTVEQSDLTIRIRQSGETSRLGFVKVGSEIEMVSRDDEYHSLRARGAEYFTLPFPAPNQPVRRKLDTPGHVEFTSAAGYFWSAADVFVCEHGFYTTTDSDGRFTLTGVPPGEYEVVTWLRNWELLGRDRDPETGKIVRLRFAEPFQQTRKVTVAGGTVTDVTFVFPRMR
ncbi:MAG: hypothetical protein ABGY75_01855 [Gemmataceae bacterium]